MAGSGIVRPIARPIEQASHSIGEHADALWVVRELRARCLFVN